MMAEGGIAEGMTLWGQKVDKDIPHVEENHQEHYQAYGEFSPAFLPYGCYGVAREDYEQGENEGGFAPCQHIDINAEPIKQKVDS